MNTKEFRNLKRDVQVVASELDHICGALTRVGQSQLALSLGELSDRLYQIGDDVLKEAENQLHRQHLSACEAQKSVISRLLDRSESTI